MRFQIITLGGDIFENACKIECIDCPFRYQKYKHFVLVIAEDSPFFGVIPFSDPDLRHVIKLKELSILLNEIKKFSLEEKIAYKMSIRRKVDLKKALWFLETLIEDKEKFRVDSVIDENTSIDEFTSHGEDDEGFIFI